MGESVCCTYTLFFFLALSHVHARAQSEILRHTSGGDNWINIEYAERLGAQAALAKNGRVFFGGVMLGVVPAQDVAAAAAIESAAAHNSSGGANGSGGSVRRALGKELRAGVETPAYAAELRGAPQPSGGALSRFFGFVLGD